MSTAPVIVLAHSPAFRLGLAEVRPATRELIGPARREIVEPRVMQVLVALASAGGEILSRDDLIQACWEGIVVSENAIDRVISKIRRLAESIAEESFRVETITKVGYRLLEEGQAPPSPSIADRPGTPRPVDRRTLIGGGLALAVGAAVVWFGVRESPPDLPPEAAQLYERGLEALRRGAAEDTAQAVSAFREVVAIAPDFADGWGNLALAYEVSLYFAPPEAAATVRERARSAARRALELDPDNAGALAAEALAVPVYANWAVAEAALRRVLALDSRQMEARTGLSRVLADVGRTRDALDALDPVAAQSASMPFLQYWLGWLLWSAGRLDECDRLLDRARTLWPRQFAVWFTRFWTYAYTGRAPQALALAADVAGRPLGIPERDFEIVELSARAFMTRSAGDIDAAVRANMAAAPAGAGYCQNAIMVSAFLGRLDDAFVAAGAYYFGRAFRVASTHFTRQQGGYIPPEHRATAFLFGPPCRPLRSDRRFAGLIGEIGLDDYWRRSGTSPDAGVPRS